MTLASIEDPAAIKKILERLDRRAQAAPLSFRPFARAPPQFELSGSTRWQCILTCAQGKTGLAVGAWLKLRSGAEVTMS
ncbi:MAG: hypothetical protein EXR86_09190 [Gammaproteobacteria bacterium]|nr:hypothetical protein [Gammaproteobacteria bacterium]